MSSERTSVNRRASVASRRGVRVGADPRRPGTCPTPATTMLPERTSSPAALATGSDSPVSSDSSTSSPSAISCPTVGRDLVAGAQLEEVVDHDRFDRDLGRSGRRARRAPCGALRTASRSSVRFARYSCTMPMSAFATSTMPNSASWIGPTIEDQDEHRPEDRVEPREDVGAGDLRQRAARALVGHVDVATRDPFGDLGRGQPVGPGRLAGVSRRGQLGRGRGHARER